LLAYSRAGGRLVFSGAENTALFAGAMNLRCDGKPVTVSAFIGGGEVLANCKGLWQNIDPGPAQVLATRHPDHDTRRDGQPAAVLSNGIVAVPGPLGQIFAATHAPAVRAFIDRLVSPRFQPLVSVDGPPTLEVVLRRKSGRLMIHLLNATGMQVAGDYAAIDFIPPIGPVTLKLAPRLAAQQAALEPSGRPLPISAAGEITVPRVPIHEIVAVTTRTPVL
jgi:hypothetical protein